MNDGDVSEWVDDDDLKSSGLRAVQVQILSSLPIYMNMKINWKNIERFGDKYAVSDCGQIRNNKTGKILKQTIHKNGYYNITIRPHGREGKCFSLKVHREVALAFIPIVPDKPQVNHIDGVKTNNCVNNLEWVDNRENNLHGRKIGLIDDNHKIGENNYGSKLSKEQVDYIRQNYKPWDKQFGARALGRSLGVSHAVIVRVADGTEWKHSIDMTA